jgi:hypothetical protein
VPISIVITNKRKIFEIPYIYQSGSVLVLKWQITAHDSSQEEIHKKPELRDYLQTEQ